MKNKKPSLLHSAVLVPSLYRELLLGPSLALSSITVFSFRPDCLLTQNPALLKPHGHPSHRGSPAEPPSQCPNHLTLYNRICHDTIKGKLCLLRVKSWRRNIRGGRQAGRKNVPNPPQASAHISHSVSLRKGTGLLRPWGGVHLRGVWPSGIHSPLPRASELLREVLPSCAHGSREGTASLPRTAARPAGLWV